MSGQWSNGLCGCFNDCSTCITSYFCPCYVFGKNAEAVGDNCCLCGISYFIAPVNIYTRLLVRGKIRDKAGVEGTCVKDCLCVWFCPLCTLVQEAQELKAPDSAPMARE